MKSFIVNAINKLRLPVPICTERTQSSDVQGNINKIIIVNVKFILTFTIISFLSMIVFLLPFQKVSPTAALLVFIIQKHPSFRRIRGEIIIGY